MVDSTLKLGGKAKNLLILKNLGINVPAFQVLDAALINNWANGDHLVIDEQALSNFLSKLNQDLTFAVRSSGIDEDGVSHSFAGQFETKLHVPFNELNQAIEEVWKSANSERVISYRKENNLAEQQEIAVIIQEMIPSEVSGVAFGANPVTGDINEHIISAVYGLGEGLVSGDLNADTFTLKEGQIIDKTIALKDSKYIFNGSNGILKIDVSPEIYEVPSLTIDQLRSLSKVLKGLQNHFNHPQDIEFAFFKNELFILQTRPITTLPKLTKKGEFIIWDNSNIIESYPGVSSPMTFSFISRVYEAVYRQFSQLMGVSQKEVDANAVVFENMLGHLNGRVYYNLLSWYKALAMLPGYSLNAEFMEKMMGVKERFELKDLPQRSKFSERLRVLNMVRIMFLNLWKMPKMKRKFVNDFNATMSKYDAIDFSQKDAFEIMELYRDFEMTLLKKWKAPLVNDFFAMIFFGVLQKLVDKYDIDDSGTIHNDLMCGAQDIISTEPIRRCLTISEAILNNREAKVFFLNNSPDKIWEVLENKHPDIFALIDAYITKFGNRCVGELKLETITYQQEPVRFVKIVKSYVEQGVTFETNSSDVDVQIRQAAESKVSKALKGKIIKRWIFNYFLKKSRRLVSDRENLRFERTRGFGMIRKMTLALGENFHKNGIIDEPRDIFFLAYYEIFNYIKGTSIHPNLKSLIALRKSEYAVFEEKRTAERVPTYGIVYHENDFYSTAKKPSITDGDLTGLACCPGVVKAKVQVIHDPSEVENLNGDILVTSSTDPGWVTLFPTASAILVERGSLLSHSAIVSREMGKPCIVGITGLLDTLRTGDLVEMDGSTGKIKIIKE